MAIIEANFPRGGLKPRILSKAKKTVSLFGTAKSKSKISKPSKKQRVRKSEHTKTTDSKTSESKTLIATSAECFTYKSIQEGMVVLACVGEVNNMSLSVSLPGRLSGLVLVTNISAPYTRALHNLTEDISEPDYKPLADLFSPGQYVCAKVLEIKELNSKQRLNLSLAPHDTHSDWQHANVTKGVVLMGAVKSVEEHGYVIDLGISNCRAFLPKNEVNSNTLGIGELVWCVVTKSTSTSATTTVTLSADTDKISKSTAASDVTLHTLLPGMNVQCTVDQLLQDGLQVKFLDNFTGYINDCHLTKPLDVPSNYSKEQQIQACVMYVMPTSKLTYLTLRSLDVRSTVDKIKVGEVRNNAMVISKATRGIYLKLSKHARGFITFSRIKTKTNLIEKSSDEDFIASKYRKGTCHTVRVLHFDPMDRVYVCSDEPDVVKEKVFTYTDLQPGQMLPGVIKNIVSKGIVVDIGKLTGIVTLLHISDTPVSPVLINSRYSSGNKVNVRVLNVDKDSKKIQLTMKPGLLDSKLPILASYEMAERGKHYEGVVVQVTSSGVLVAFFGDVTGFIPRNQLSFEAVKHPEKSFFIGRVLKCTVLQCDVTNKRITLTLQGSKSKSTRNVIKLGQHLTGTVSAVSEEGLKVSVRKATGAVPSMHLTQHTSLCELILGTYVEGEKINNLVCINTGHGMPILSIREGVSGDYDSEDEVETNKSISVEDVMKWSDVKEDTLLKGSIQLITDNVVMLQCPIEGLNRLAVIPAHDITDFPNVSVDSLKLVKHQPLYARVMTIDHDKQDLQCTSKLSEVWDFDVQPSVDLLATYVRDVERIHERWRTTGRPLGDFSLGQSVTGKVTRLLEDIRPIKGAVIELLQGVEGVVQSFHSKGGIKVGDTVEGVIIWLDFVHNCAEIALSNDINNKINNKQGMSVAEGAVVRGQILLVRPDFAIATLRGAGRGQLALLPIRSHLNDLLPDTTKYDVGSVYKMVVMKNQNNRPICVLKQQLREDSKKAKMQAKRSRKISENDSIPEAKKAKIEKPTLEHKSKIKKKKTKKEIAESDSIQQVKEAEEEKPATELKSKVNQKKTKKIKVAESAQNVDVTIEPSVKTKKKETINHDEAHKESGKVKSKINETKHFNLLLPGVGDFWNLGADLLKTQNDDSTSSDDELEQQDKSKKKKKLSSAERQKAFREDEARIRSTEQALVHADEHPQSADHFDRLLLANPDSSLVWINYMAFHLQATEIEKARAVARKALSTISFREEQEKLNVWVALLNLENRYGTKESFSEVLQEASRMNDPVSVYTQALHILAESSKEAELTEMVNLVTRRYKASSEAWLNSGAACFKAGLVDKARQLMQRALASIENKQHVDLISRFSAMENRHGNGERAQALMEQVLTSYPRRVDIWAQYVDMLIKGGQIPVARQVLERAVSQKLPARKMKTLYKKFLEFESVHGDTEAVLKVRQMAASYVQSATS